MIKIGKTYIVRTENSSRLCADIAINNRRTTLWFAVEHSQESFLSIGRSDAFVLLLLPAAMRSGHEIICEDAMSERLQYQLSEYLIPTLAFAGTLYHRIRIKALLTTVPFQNCGAVGTGFSGGVDSLYTIMRHDGSSEYPLTHIAVFNSGVFEGLGYRSAFLKSCQEAVRFAKEQKFQTVFVDTNFNEALPERFLDVYSFRNLACALALQGLFSVYLLSSGHDAANFELDLRNTATYDLLTTSCTSTESLTFYFSGAEVKRWKKLYILSDWEPSWNWLHPCIFTLAGKYNCGQCRKCIRDQTTLYSLGRLDRYRKVFDVENYLRHFPQRLGFVMANRGNHLFDETMRLLEDQKVNIPQAAYIYEKQFRKAMRNLETEKKRAEGKCL